MPITLPPISRRRFLAGSLAAGAALVFRRPLFGADGAATADPHRFALLSDTHVAADAAKVYKNVNMAANLRQVCGDVLALDTRPAAAIVNGDLAFGTGEAADYATFVGLVKPVREAGVPVHLALGNHDHRERFWAASPPPVGDRRAVADRHALVIEAERANWYVLDSLDKTNVTPGLLGAKQVAWLAGALDANPKKPALVMVHHDVDDKKAAGEKTSLIDQQALLDVLRPRKQVKALFFGHSHNWSVTKAQSGIHFVNFPPVAYTFKEGPPIGWVDARVGNGGMTVELRCVDPKHPKHGEKRELTWRD